jgi:hypothetical protein
VPALSKSWVCGRSLAGIVGPNLAGGMDVRLLRELCVVRQRSVPPDDHSSRGVQSPSAVYLSDCEASVCKYK